MRRWLLRREILAFGRRYDYDIEYMMAMLQADVGMTWHFARLPAFARHRRGVPRAAWHAAKLRVALAEDCGPCTQLMVTMAERAGVSAALLRATIVGDYAALPAEVALACRFADAVALRDPETDALRRFIVEAWGEAALVALSVSLAISRVFPSVKYAMGHGRACTRVNVAGAPVPVLRHAA